MKRKAAYRSKDTWKEEGVLSEFISQEKEEGTIELVQNLLILRLFFI